MSLYDIAAADAEFRATRGYEPANYRPEPLPKRDLLEMPPAEGPTIDDIVRFQKRYDALSKVPTHLPNDLPPYDYEVKSWPQFFEPMIAGKKMHDMRNKRDRSYKVGDRVLLREFDPFGSGYTGRCAVAVITYITSNDTPCALSSVGLGNDMAILSVRVTGPYPNDDRNA